MTPIFKSGDKHNVANYRPISIMGVIPKLFDSIMATRLTNVISSSICPQQHGFMPGRSTVSNLSLYSEFIAKALENS